MSERAQQDYDRVMTVIGFKDRGPAQRLYDISDLFGFLESGAAQLDREQLSTMQDTLLTLRKEALVDDPYVEEDEAWGNTEWALDQLAKLIGLSPKRHIFEI